MKINSKTKFSKDFWTKHREYVTVKEKNEDMIPFKWSNDVKKGKGTLTLAKSK